MREVLERLIDDFQERQLPELVRREAVAPEVSGKANAAVGMRRAGKTWLCSEPLSAYRRSEQTDSLSRRFVRTIRVPRNPALDPPTGVRVRVGGEAR